LDDNANAADGGQADTANTADQTDQSMQQDQADNDDTTVIDRPIVTTQDPSPVPTAPAGQFDQDMQHLMIHLGDLKAFLIRFEHKVDGKIGEIVAFLKEHL
jgi:hypothetical protein